MTELHEGESLIEDMDETLLRQVHPALVDRGIIMKAAFEPSARDNDRLSTMRERVTAAEAHQRWVDRGYESIGTYGVLVGFAASKQLPAIDDEATVEPDHASLDFAELGSRGAKQRAARALRDHASDAGCLHPALDND